MIVNGIVMVPLYFKFMSVSTYGAWLATGNLVAMLGLVESGFAGVITQKMSVALTQKNDHKFKQLAGANVYTAVLMASILFLIGLIISPFIADWINAEESITHAIKIAFIISLASAAISLIVSLLGAFPQVWQETKTIGIINTIVNIVGIASLVIYLYSGFGVISLALGYFTRAVLNLLGQGTWILIKWRKLKLSLPLFNLKTIKNLLRDCLYPFLSKISIVFMGYSQSFIIALFINPAMAAIYDITSKITVVACNFVNMANGSFFAMYSLTFATKNKRDIENTIKNVTTFIMTFLFTAILYSLCFTKPIIHFWVGLDKYGGDLLLVLIIFSILITQIKSYFNNLLYTGGLINQSAKFDIFSVILYIVILFSIISTVKIYAIPIASFISGAVFFGLYLKMMKTKLQINTNLILKIILKLSVTAILFVFLNILFKIDLLNAQNLVIYLVVFSSTYIAFLFFTNKEFVLQIFRKLKYANK